MKVHGTKRSQLLTSEPAPVELKPETASCQSNRREFLGSVGAAAMLGSGPSEPAVPTREGALSSKDSASLFQSAQAVWLQGRETEMNLHVGFRAVIHPHPGPVQVRVAASSLYRLRVNGEFLGHGPARAAHGFYRIDEWDVPDHLLRGHDNIVSIEVAGYNINSYYLLNQPAFLRAEVVGGSQVLAATNSNGDGFDACPLSWRVQKTQRYSFQRTFSEVYRLSPGFDLWAKEPEAIEDFAMNRVVTGPHEFLPRRVPYPRFRQQQPILRKSRGRFQAGTPTANPWKDRSLTAVGETFLGYPEKELETIPSLELQGTETRNLKEQNEAFDWETQSRIEAGDFEIYDFGINYTGFFGCRVTCNRPTRLIMTFDEILSDRDVDFKRLSCVNAVVWELESGQYDLETFEPYTLRFLKIMCFEGDSRIDQVFLREFSNPDVDEAQFAASDSRLNSLFAAARETFRQNSVDLFMDCPSRERAGWLCDSFFTSRAASVLSNDLSVEKNFMENYLLPDSFSHLPSGMIPMCYPADHYDGIFIPNWALWFVLQLQEYLARSADYQFAPQTESRLRKLFDYFRGFENEDGLLEKLESWVFIEWSAANDFAQGVNYPSNMLYAAAMDAAGWILPDDSMLERASKLRETIRNQSFDGDFFVDNAVRRSTGLEATRNRTEVCQYFAFYFGIADPSTHRSLWNRLTDEFGPDRVSKGLYPEIHPANSFVGNVLRLELLSRLGLGRQMLNESVSYLLYMAERTGTLWENTDTRASCDHGFASHACFSLYRDVVGCYEIDHPGKRVVIRLLDLDLDWAEGRIPGPCGPVEIRWQRKGDTVDLKAIAPAGYRVAVENPAGLQIRLNS